VRALFERAVEVAARSRSLTQASAPPAGLRVLLAEDDRTNQLVAKAMLRRLGCAVEVVANGQDAVAAACASAYDVVFMDVQMPGMDGLEATRELRRHGVRVPIVALTAHASHEAREQCLEVGMDDYVSKPIDPAALARALTAVCGHASPRPDAATN
jgi:CheY-like chemotaxis protein